MSMKYDATIKDMAGLDPPHFLAELDGAAPATPVRLLNVDLSTVTAATDVVFGLGDPLREVVHLDAQAGPDAGKHLDLLAYGALLYRQYRVPVHSILLLLRRQAQLRVQTGNIFYAARPGLSKMNFNYDQIRLWERPVEGLLASGLTTLPLAPLCRLPAGMSLDEGMRWVLTRVVERLEAEGDPRLVPRLLTATFVLSGLRLNREQIRSIFSGVRAMRESDTYQAILEEGREEGRDEGIVKGRIEGVQRTLLRQGHMKLGEPSEAIRSALYAIQDLERLERLSERIFVVATWQELLQTP